MERNEDSTRSLGGIIRLSRLVLLYPTDSQPITHTDTWMREWAKAQGMGLQTLYRAETDGTRTGLIRTHKQKVPNKNGKLRHRKVWTFYPLQAYTELGEARLEALGTRLTASHGKLTLKEAEEELDNVRAYLLELIDKLSKPDLTRTDADHIYSPAIGILGHWVGEIYLALRKHRVP